MSVNLQEGSKDLNQRFLKFWDACLRVDELMEVFMRNHRPSEIMSILVSTQETLSASVRVGGDKAFVLVHSPITGFPERTLLQVQVGVGGQVLEKYSEWEKVFRTKVVIALEVKILAQARLHADLGGATKSFLSWVSSHS